MKNIERKIQGACSCKCGNDCHQETKIISSDLYIKNCGHDVHNFFVQVSLFLSRGTFIK